MENNEFNVTMFSSEYGTRQYLKEYIASEFERIRLVKCVNGELLIGFVQDMFTDRVTIDFPLSLTQTGSNQFFMEEYTPELEFKTVTFNKSHVMFETIAGMTTISSYIEYLKEYTFLDAWDADPLAHQAPEEIQ